MYSYNEKREVGPNFAHLSYTTESKTESARDGLFGKDDGSLERHERQLGSA